jgi:DNA polymerase-3 subunit epsilon
MKLVVLDTETTGLAAAKGDRMVEIGAIEVDAKGHEINTFHHYINPECPIPEAVVRIHGIDDEQVQNKPVFSEIADSFLDFIEGATLVIHNASFDLSFIEYELSLCGRPSIAQVPVVDTLQIARRKFPGQKNSLDALCDRYGIARDHRHLHGALLDAKLLTEVYCAMVSGNSGEIANG